MDITTLASTAVALLSPYLTKGGEEFAKTIGKSIVEKVSQLYEIIKTKLKGNVYAEQTLTRTEEQPTSESRQTALIALLTELIEEDPAFAQKIRQLVEEIQKSETDGDQMTAVGNYIAQANRGSTATVQVNQSKK
jgi:hypothetical protein